MDDTSTYIAYVFCSHIDRFVFRLIYILFCYDRTDDACVRVRVIVRTHDHIHRCLRLLVRSDISMSGACVRVHAFHVFVVSNETDIQSNNSRRKHRFVFSSL
jgi:hypothetical protein